MGRQRKVRTVIDLWQMLTLTLNEDKTGYRHTPTVLSTLHKSYFTVSEIMTDHCNDIYIMARHKGEEIEMNS